MTKAGRCGCGGRGIRPIFRLRKPSWSKSVCQIAKAEAITHDLQDLYQVSKTSVLIICNLSMNADCQVREL